MHNTSLAEAIARVKREREVRAASPFATYFPDCDPQVCSPDSYILEDHKGLCRVLWPKHVAFMNAGARYRERLFMAGNRCLTAASRIDTEAGAVTMGELYLRGAPVRVKAWDGHRKVIRPASAPFRKPGLHDCYRITMSDGSWVAASAAHRIMMADGSWLATERVFNNRPLFVDGKVIRQIDYVGKHEVFDLTVEGLHNYTAGGLVHHNSGKTTTGSKEIVSHATGRYPDWWKGRRFEGEINAWVAGDTGKTVRDIIQKKLVGPFENIGSGFLTRRDIEHYTRKQGISDAIDQLFVRHVERHHGAPLISTITMKSYDQRRISFQGDAVHVVWLDEEPPNDVYSECLLRTLRAGDFEGGLLMLTFTPLMGLSDVVRRYFPRGFEVPKTTLEDGEVIHGYGEIEDDEGSKKFGVVASWDDVPHLTEEDRKELLSSMLPHERDARTRGYPMLGAGAVYPVPESDISIPDFEVPHHWPKGYGLDVGWNVTAAPFFAYDKQNDILYVTGCYRGTEAPPEVHAGAIKRRGEWLPGCIDPAARQRNQKDGSRLIKVYRDCGLNLSTAPNAVDAGIREVWQRLSQGRLLVFESCTAWFQEFRSYHRDENGEIVKENDHLMDGTRYGVLKGTGWLKRPPNPDRMEPVHTNRVPPALLDQGWLGS